ncbi:MAG: hypothetical protein ACI4IH_03960 [Eubacterium sp.]
MSSKFNKLFNKYADVANAMNKNINQMVGKDVLGEMKKIEEPKEFAPYNTFPDYQIPEPEQWTALNGEAREFEIEGSIISVSANLDACIQYHKDFLSTARYYANRFKFKYQNCVNDYDSLLHYFDDLFYEGLSPMVERAYGLLLPFGVFNVNIQSFTSRHGETYHSAISSYKIMAGIEEAKNQSAQSIGNQIGNSIQLQGGGFGVKGAAKGIAQAEAFNVGMNLLGKLVAHQNSMSQEDKQKVYAGFNQKIFFDEVYRDYADTYYTLINILSENGVLGNVTTLISDEYKTILENLKNPMFPKEQTIPAIVKLINTNPFVLDCYDLLKEKSNDKEAAEKITRYFTEN